MLLRSLMEKGTSMTKLTIILGLLGLLVVSCGTPTKTSQETSEATNRTSSKFLYSLMIKDSVALDSILSDNLKKKVKGEMVLKAFSAVEKKKGAMKGILFTGKKGDMALYEVKTKSGSIPLKLKLDKLNKVEAVWIDDLALNSK